MVSLTLVRERAGVIAFDPPDVDASDRWKVQLTCDREGGGTAISGTATYLAPGAEVGTGEPDA